MGSKRIEGMVRFAVYIVLAVLVSAPVWAGRPVLKRIAVAEALKVELNKVLKATDELHSACVEGDDAKIRKALTALVGSLEQAESRSVLAGSERTHLVRVLNAAKGQVEMARMQSASKRERSLKSAFKNLVQVAQTYDVDKYKIFFCSRDKSVWLQKGRKPKNPIHPRLYPRCGQLVR
jgi:hypothetical protein